MIKSKKTHLKKKCFETNHSSDLIGIETKDSILKINKVFKRVLCD